MEGELTHLTRVFESNDYPTTFVRRVLGQPPTQSNGSACKIEEEEESKPKVLHLPYIRGVSERIERGCRNLGVRTVFKSGNTLRQTLMNVKSRTPKECKRGAVYEIPCADCDSVYIGETGRSLKDWIKEHKYAVNRRHEERSSRTCLDFPTQGRLVLSQSKNSGTVPLEAEGTGGHPHTERGKYIQS